MYIRGKFMLKNILGLIISILFIGIVILSAKFFEKAGKEASRKYIHIMLSNYWFIAMYFFDHAVWAAILPFIFIIVNYISYKKDLIAVMERDKQDGLGTVYYAISLFVISIYTFGIIHNPAIGLVSILIMGYGDGLAGVIGRAVKSKKYKIGDTTKSLAGSVTMFVISAMISATFFLTTGIGFWLVKTVLVAIVATILEAVSIKGLDNITVPVGVCLLLRILVNLF